MKKSYTATLFKIIDADAFWAVASAARFLIKELGEKQRDTRSVDDLKAEMHLAASESRFEEAAHLKQLITLLS